MSNKLIYPICLALVLALSGFAQAELLLNPGFEDGLDYWKAWGGGSGSGAGGYFWSSAYGATVIEDGTAHSGNAYIEASLANDHDGWWWNGMWVMQEHPVTEGKTYQISGWVRDGDADGAPSLIADGVKISWEWRDAAPVGDPNTDDRGEKLPDGVHNYAFDLTEAWTYVSATEVAPPGALGLTVSFLASAGINFDIDDASYVELVTIPVPDAGFDAHVLSEGGYVYIGDDSYTGAWKSHASAGAWLDYGYYDDDLPALSGNNKVYGSEDSTEDYIYQILDETFIEGATYTLSVWVGQPWDGYARGWWLYFTGEDYENNLIEASGSAPASWEQVSLVYTATAADAGKMIGIKMQGAAESWVSFEDVTLSYVAGAEPGVTIPVDPNSDLAASNALANPGDTILFAEGTYDITSQIEIKDGVTYQGAGAGLTIIDGNDTTRAFVAWGDRGATDGQVDANGVSLLNLTGPKGWVLEGLTIQNCTTGAENRQDILSAARDLLTNYAAGTPYTLATAQAENGGVTGNPEWFDILSGSADDDLTDVELQAYLDANPVGSLGHIVVNGDKDDDAAAVNLDNHAAGTIRNCAFSNNSADDDGGAIMLNGASAATIQNCAFSENWANDDGGAIMVDGDALVVAIEDCTFNLNTCGDVGGAVKLSGAASNSTVTGCSFTENSAPENDGGAIIMDGAGDAGSTYTLTGCTFTNCSAFDDGGAILASADNSTYVWTNCAFIGNYVTDSGADGGAVRYAPDRAEITVTNCSFIGNGKDPNGTPVGDDGGAWKTDDDDCGPVTFMNCLFADNASKDDRILEVKGGSAIINCTFIGNVAGDEALIAVRGAPWNSTGDTDENGDDIDDVTTDDSIIANCLFINNTLLSNKEIIGDTQDGVFAPTVTNCLFFGNLDQNGDQAENIDGNSQEVGTIDVSAVTDAAQVVVDPAGDYHLAAGSPAIDASDPATATDADIEGMAAVGVRDVGAYEAPAN